MCCALFDVWGHGQGLMGPGHSVRRPHWLMQWLGGLEMMLEKLSTQDHSRTVKTRVDAMWWFLKMQKPGKCVHSSMCAHTYRHVVREVLSGWPLRRERMMRSPNHDPTRRWKPPKQIRKSSRLEYFVWSWIFSTLKWRAEIWGVSQGSHLWLLLSLPFDSVFSSFLH